MSGSCTDNTHEVSFVIGVMGVAYDREGILKGQHQRDWGTGHESMMYEILWHEYVSDRPDVCVVLHL